MCIKIISEWLCCFGKTPTHFQELCCFRCDFQTSHCYWISSTFPRINPLLSLFVCSPPLVNLMDTVKWKISLPNFNLSFAFPSAPQRTSLFPFRRLERKWWRSRVFIKFRLASSEDGSPYCEAATDAAVLGTAPGTGRHRSFPCKSISSEKWGPRSRSSHRIHCRPRRRRHHSFLCLRAAKCSLLSGPINWPDCVSEIRDCSARGLVCVPQFTSLSPFGTANCANYTSWLCELIHC